MRSSTLLALTSAVVALAATPLLADQPAPNTAASDPVEVSIAPDELLAPYYARLRQSVVLPTAGEAPALDTDQTLTRIAFGSCNHQSGVQTMWEQIQRADPQIFMMLGDNVYGDTGWDADAGLESLRRAYMLQSQHREWQELRAAVPMLATWDDHDFGLNDAGGSFPMRRWAETMFEEFWGSSAQVRSRPGIYDSVMVGPEGKRVQIITLDTRFFRSNMERYEWTRQRRPLGVYKPNTDPNSTVLGAQQWAWLEAELAKPADLRIVASSIQMITEAHDYESWENFPHERARLFETLNKRASGGVVLLSGDRHSGGIYEYQANEPFYEITSSALNMNWDRNTQSNSEREPDDKRISPFFSYANYGLVDIDWKAKSVTLSLKGDDSRLLAAHSYSW